MFTCKFGSFNGTTWESLCQQVFKSKYQSEDYQQMPASPGDFGLEGVTLKSGWGFQCYCPDKHYERKELYEKQRDKITEDLSKLKTFSKEIQQRIGDTKICHWVFVTPEYDKNNLLAHARTKEKAVRGWGLPFITSDFTVLLYDGDSYLIEINQILAALGESLVLDESMPVLPELTGPREEYERNLQRKSEARLSAKQSSVHFEQHVKRMTQETLETFLATDGYFRRVADSAPMVHFKLIRLINEFEKYVFETSATWNGTPQGLTEQVRDALEERILMQLGPSFGATNASKVARHMVARWLAVCELDYD